MSISSDRIERAENEAVKIFEAHTHYVIGETRGGVPLDGFIRSKLERAIADAIAAAEMRGKLEGLRKARNIARETDYSDSVIEEVIAQIKNGKTP